MNSCSMASADALYRRARRPRSLPGPGVRSGVNALRPIRIDLPSAGSTQARAQSPLSKNSALKAAFLPGKTYSINWSADQESITKDLNRWLEAKYRFDSHANVDQAFIYDFYFDSAQYARWSAIRRDVRIWENLLDGWDGNEAVAIPPPTIDNLRDILDALEDAGAPPPEHYIASDGEISLRWRKARAFASISLPLDGAVVAYVHDAEERVTLECDTALGEPFDMTRFVQELRSFA